MKYVKGFNQLFEYRTGTKLKTRWTIDDAIITLYYQKFGLEGLIHDDNLEDFVNEYIGSTADSIKMQALNIKYILSVKKHSGSVPTKPEGLRNFSNAQVKAVEKYDNLTKPELRQVVQKILNSVTEDKKIENLIRVETGEKEIEKKVPLVIKQQELKNKFGRPLTDFYDLFDENAIIPVKSGDIINHRKFGKGFIFDVVGNWIEIKYFDNDKIQNLIYNPKLFINDDEIVKNFIKPKIKNVKRTRNYNKWKREQGDNYRDLPEEKLKKIKIKKDIKKDIKKPDIVELPKKLKSINQFQNIPQYTNIPYEIGNIINHRKFGEGKIINIDNKFLIVNFNGDTKKVLYKPEFFR